MNPERSAGYQLQDQYTHGRRMWANKKIRKIAPATKFDTDRNPRAWGTALIAGRLNHATITPILADIAVCAAKGSIG